MQRTEQEKGEVHQNLVTNETPNRPSRGTPSVRVRNPKRGVFSLFSAKQLWCTSQ